MHASTPSLQQSYAETGRGPAILLLHSGDCDQSFLDSQRQLLSNCGHRVIATNPARAAAAGPFLVELLNFLGLGRVLIIALDHGNAGQILQQMAPERVVDIKRVGKGRGACTSLAQALSQASRDAQVRRTPLQRLNRHLSGLLNALLPPDDSVDEPVREQH